MNKLTKLLSVFMLAGAIGTGAAGVAACNKGGDDSGHSHSYDYQQIAGDSQKHTVHCTNDGHEGGDTQENHSWSGNECSKCHYVKPGQGSELEVPANVTGLLIEGVSSGTVALSATKTSHTIDRSAIKVYYATGNNADVKGDEVPAANVVLELKDSTGAAVSSWENITREGAYKINASLQNATMASGAVATIGDLKATVTVTISNPVVTDSLAVKTGTLTQDASVINKMTDWTYTVTRANGDVEDYTGEVTVQVNTSTTGEQTAVLKSGSLTGSVKVTITAAQGHTATYAVNLSGKEIGVLAGEATADSAVELFKSADGNTKLEARGVKVEANGNNAAKECDGKYFVNRAPFAGATFTSANALQTNQRYFILTTEGASQLTIYWSRNSSSDERGISVFNSTVTDGDISALKPDKDTVAKATIGGDSGKETTQAVQKMVVNIPAAGTYWITTANNQNVYFYYMELTTEFDGAGENIELEDGDVKLADVKVSHTADGYKQQFTVGDTFSVDGGYSVKGTFITANTAKKSEQPLTDVTYWIGGTQLTPGTTKLSADLFENLGENTVTVKYGDSAVTGSYTIFVDSAVAGVTGITASVKSTVNPVLSSESATLTLAKSDIVAAIVGENTNASITAYTVKYRLKSAAEGSETEITESAELGVGDYVFVVTATVTDSVTTNSVEFSAIAALRVTVEGNGASWLYQTENSTLGADNPGIAKNAVIDENGSFKAVALDGAVAGYNKDSTNFGTKISDTSNAPKAAEDKTASGEAITFTNAVAFDAKPGASGADYIEITAKKATKVYVYLNASDDKHGSNRSGAAITYSVNGGTASEIAVGNRKDVTVVEVTLAEGDTLVIGAKQGTATNDPRIWLYGIESVDVA